MVASGGGQQHQVGDVVLAGVAGALEAVHGHRRAAQALGLQGVAHRGALVDHLDAVLIEQRHEGFRAAPGGFHDLDTGVDDHLGVLFVRHRLDGRQQRQVDAERLVGHFLAAGDLLGEIFRRGLGQPGDDAQRAGVGHRRRQFRVADILHAALDDRVAGTQQFCKTCFH
jgi:hypothetical protein